MIRARSNACRTRLFPRSRNRSGAEHADVFFWDESRFRADSVHGKTWVQRGGTPVVEKADERRSMSAISAVNSKGACWFDTYAGALTREFVSSCLLWIHSYHLTKDWLMDREIAKRLYCLLTYRETGHAGPVRGRCGISRPTLRKWVTRHRETGEQGLHSHNRRPFKVRAGKDRSPTGRQFSAHARRRRDAAKSGRTATERKAVTTLCAPRVDLFSTAAPRAFPAHTMSTSKTAWRA
ncbi:transposase [Paraburkholderia sp. NPDC080076]|uniref:transposase n=1 Tax=Paraburkholderia sp. NPDC080076 TaxID=3390605 RepID=UPI003D0049EB